MDHSNGLLLITCVIIAIIIISLDRLAGGEATASRGISTLLQLPRRAECLQLACLQE